MTKKIITYNEPRHVLIIPDGNRRWATKKGQKPYQGHKRGAERIEEIVRQALKMKIKYLTLWGSSKDNLKKRSLVERRGLLKIYKNYFTKLISNQDIINYQVKIGLIGKWQQQFPAELKKILRTGVKKTKLHNDYFLNFLLAYNGDDDLIYAIKKIVNQSKNNENIVINQKLIADNLMSASLPPVDLIIRTGVEGDPHNSVGVLMWQTQNAQYYFSSKMMPDFSANDFKKAIENFNQRKRRMGK